MGAKRPDPSPVSSLLRQWRSEPEIADQVFREGVWRKIALRELESVKPLSSLRLSLASVSVGILLATMIGLALGELTANQLRKRELSQSLEQYLTAVDPYRLAELSKP
ncbi:hypothetical protein [Candidatus Methylacidithermus pantelleriae]|uniref:Uncharacterized protein n=1 Tax=Candidatus Methylacidithermus pantelleriae TaxID=2744239 RepID=A0A8J2FRR4_9BACT|nr:hypothetical protein [Candidatus Methylacidithermus pantelleriae]CAF0689779.1 conserved hypothetical protein [Candidatus Methylacidithermus pantelleriae]